MYTAHGTSDLLQLFLSLDSADTLDRKLSLLSHWAGRLSGVQEFRYIPFDQDGPFTEEDKELSPESPALITASSSLTPFFQSNPSWAKGCLYYPLPEKNGRVDGALLYRTDNPSALLMENNTVLGLAASKFADGVYQDRLVKAAMVPAPEHWTLADPVNRHILETLSLPLYLMDLSGRFLFANKPFFNHFGYSDLEDLNDMPGGFFDPVERAESLRALARSGATSGQSLGVFHRAGSQMSVRDFAVLKEGLILGVLFDVTEYVSLNQEMKEALEIQELLNDKIISSALILQKTQTTSIRALARLAEYRDQETGNHLQRICEYTGILTKEVYKRQPFDFKITEQYVEDMVLSSMLHDIGKVAVPDSILRKKNNLTPEEWDVMKKHTVWGWQILSQADKELGEQSFLTLASQIAMGHHEKWDGTGYPSGLKADKIPLSARIESLADVYDALTSVRPYKHAWSHEEALDEIKNLKGIHFDPVLVDILMEIQEKFREVKDQYAGETS